MRLSVTKRLERLSVGLDILQPEAREVVELREKGFSDEEIRSFIEYSARLASMTWPELVVECQSLGITV